MGMKLPAFPATLLAVCTLLFSQTARADDVKAMEGTWKVEAAEAGGEGAGVGVFDGGGAEDHGDAV